LGPNLSPLEVLEVNPRAAAILILARVEDRNAFLNVAIDAHLRRHRPSDPRDAALITELCYGAARFQMTLDHVLAAQSQKRLDRLERRVLAALRIGTYQLFYMRLPPHAAVAETIEALKQLGQARAAGFANAILRKLSAMGSPPLPPESDGVEQLALRHSHPQWLVARWIQQFGIDQAKEMLSADNQPAPVAIRANLLKTSRDDLLAGLRRSGADARAAELSPSGIILRSPGRLEELYGYAEGLWQVQDEAAQLVGHYAAVPEGSRVLDACAAPGGKACHLAERHSVVAADLSAGKLERLQSEAKRLGLSSRIETVVHDATQPFPPRLGKFDAVLVDAPCSGLGTLRRHPELRYRRQESDIERLAQLQWSIVQNCQEVVAKGGLLIYAVCSTELEEGLQQAERLVGAHSNFAARPAELEGVRVPLWRGYLRTLPGKEGLDGFFAARFARTG
jgi:16S rRNA (cytosine967-C5)-methyltransferase